MSNTPAGRILKGRSLATHAAVVVLAASVAAATPSSAATHRGAKAALAHPYNYFAPSQADPPALTPGQLGYRVNPVLPSNGFGPPDPASCGGFHC